MVGITALSRGETTHYLVQELHGLGVTYQAIADTLGVTWMTAHRWATGESSPRPAGPINQILAQMLGDIQTQKLVAAGAFSTPKNSQKTAIPA